MNKGVMIQSKKQPAADFNSQNKDSNNIALDYYLSGVKINPFHFGCIYNAGCSYYFEGKFGNSLKWFDLAVQVDPYSLDAHFGLATVSLKLGKFQEALQAIEKVVE